MDNAANIAKTATTYAAALLAVGEIGSSVTTCYGLTGTLETTFSDRGSFYARVREPNGVLQCVPFQCFGEQ